MNVLNPDARWWTICIGCGVVIGEDGDRVEGRPMTLCSHLHAAAVIPRDRRATTEKQA